MKISVTLLVLFYLLTTLLTTFPASVHAQSDIGKGSNKIGFNSSSLNDFFKDFEKEINAFGKDIEKEINKTAKEIEVQLKDIEKEVKTNFDSSLKDIDSNIKKTADDLSLQIDKGTQDIFNQLDNAAASISNTADTASDKAAALSDKASNIVSDLDKKIDIPDKKNDIENKITIFIKNLEKELEKISDSLKKSADKGKNSVNTKIDKTSAVLTKDLKNISSKIESTYKNDVKNFKIDEKLNKDFKDLKDQFEKIGKDLETALSDMGNDFKALGDEISGDINDQIKNDKLTDMILKDLKIDDTLSASNLKNASYSNSGAAAAGNTADNVTAQGIIASPPFTWGTSPYPGEGKDNYCGQYAMATVMNSIGMNADFDKIYKDTNPAGIFTAPPTIENYLSSQGVDASMSQGNDINDMKAHLDTGKPAMILCDSGGVPHWVAVMGYQVDSSGKTTFKVCDSYWGIKDRKNGIADIPEDEFKKIWAKPLGSGVLGSLTNYSGLMVKIKGTKNPSSGPVIDIPDSTTTEDAIGGGICDVVAGWKNKKYGQVAKGAGNVLAGIPGALINLPGKALNTGGSAIDKWGKEKMEKGGFFNKLLGGAAVGLGKTGQAAGKILEFTGNAVTSAGKTVVNGISKVGNWFKSLF